MVLILAIILAVVIFGIGTVAKVALWALLIAAALVILGGFFIGRGGSAV